MRDKRRDRSRAQSRKNLPGDLSRKQLVQALQAAKISAGKIREVLDYLELRRSPDRTSPSRPATRRDSSPHILDTRAHTPRSLQRIETTQRRRREAQRLFEDAAALEESDLALARQNYLAALELHSDHVDARINLGRLLHLNGELELAEKIYRETQRTSALLSFNLGVLLEDMKRDDEAMHAYRQALALDPSLCDAHYNLSLLHERLERPQEAFKHLLAYRRHILKGS